jgi:hypothetical protein
MVFTPFKAPSPRWSGPDHGELPKDACLGQALLRIVGGFMVRGGTVHGFSLVREVERPYSLLVWVAIRLNGREVTLVFKRDRPERVEPWKGAPRTNLETEFKLMGEVSGLLAPYPDLRTPRPVAYFEDLGVLVMHHTRGDNLEEMIRRRARWTPASEAVRELSEHCARAGRWLRVFQEATTRDGARLCLDELREDIAQRLERLRQVRAGGLTRRLHRDILAHFDRSTRRIEDRELRVVKIHGDYHPGNVLVSPHQTVVLDFVRDGWGSIYHDAVRFDLLLSMLLYRGCYRPAVIRSLRKSFVGGLGADLDSRRPLARLFRIRHMVCEWISAYSRQDGPLHGKLYDRWWVGRAIPFHLRRIIAAA